MPSPTAPQEVEPLSDQPTLITCTPHAATLTADQARAYGVDLIRQADAIDGKETIVTDPGLLAEVVEFRELRALWQARVQPFTLSPWGTTWGTEPVSDP